jgi:hypothetical protein
VGFILALLGTLVSGAYGGWVPSGTDASEAVTEVLNLDEGDAMRIAFLHHSTGGLIWEGGVAEWFQEYNRKHGTGYLIEEHGYPHDRGNFPYDYWDIWVRHAGPDPHEGDATLEILTEEYDVIVWKHCFPVSVILEDRGTPDVGSPEKRLENYALQYQALREKMRQFPNCRFVLWTGAAVVRQVSWIGRIISFLKGRSEREERAKRAREFFRWVKEEWDEPGDNVYIWDFYELETGGGLYLKDEYAARKGDSHPSRRFSRDVAPLLCQRIVDVVEGRGDNTSLTGERSDEP